MGGHRGFWKQNEDLEVEIDIKADAADEAPLNSGPNLYLRIKNRRHRGVSTPFDQRSRGFIWFFSFLVWFDSVHNQLEAGANTGATTSLILLLDEPGLALHALAQADFLKYIDTLSQTQQVLYSTHSPFMVHSPRLHQVRVVEDKVGVGTTISGNVTGSDPRTIFPLQAALGWSLAQNLFISEKNLVVEGPAELIYLQFVSGLLELDDTGPLAADITIVPAGGLDKICTFVALLGANGLKLAVLHDYNGSPDQRLADLVKHKLISSKTLLDVSKFRDLKSIGLSGQASDIEDLFDPAIYLELFNKTFAQGLKGVAITEKDLPKGARIVERLERYLATNQISLRPSGGFNHYLVASTLARTPPKKLDADSLARFRALFNAVNAAM